MRWVGRATALVMLLITLGLHWGILQTVAWTRMLWGFSQSMTLGEAIARTFDGQHPCSLCLALREARQGDSKPSPAVSNVTLRWDLELAPPPTWGIETEAVELPLGLLRLPPPRWEAPPKPRPRWLAVA